MKLSKFVGRDELPSDKVAFDRLSKIFADITPGPINCQRRQRVNRPDGKTELQDKDKNNE
jgi:hypothetical protein